MHQAGVVLHVLLRNRQLRQQGFGNPIQGCQGGAFLPFRHHHLVTEILGVLLERSQFGQRIVAYKEILQRDARFVVQTVLNQLLQPFALGD